MAVIVNTVAPCHIRSSPTAPVSTPSSRDLEFTTPRALAHTIDIVAAATAALSSSSSLPITTSSEYHLSSKRKTDDRDDDDEHDLSSLEPGAKKWKADDGLSENALFISPNFYTTNGPTCISEPAPSIDDALANLYPTPGSSSVQALPLLPPSDLTPASSFTTDLLPLAEPLPSSTINYDLDVDLDAEGEDDDDDDEEDFDSHVHLRYGHPPVRVVEPPSRRQVEMPLWKLACRTRVDHIVRVYGVQAVRASVQRDILTRPPAPSPFPIFSHPPSTPSPPVVPQSLLAANDVTASAQIQPQQAEASDPLTNMQGPIAPNKAALQVEIVTPSDFVVGSSTSSASSQATSGAASNLTESEPPSLSSSTSLSPTQSSVSSIPTSAPTTSQSIPLVVTIPSAPTSPEPYTHLDTDTKMGEMEDNNGSSSSMDTSSDWSSDSDDSDYDLDTDSFSSFDEDESSSIPSSPHETLLSFPPPPSTIPTPTHFQPSTVLPLTPSPQPQSQPYDGWNGWGYGWNNGGYLEPINPMLGLLPLPRLCSIPVDNLRADYPDLILFGTPARAPDWAKGSLL